MLRFTLALAAFLLAACGQVPVRTDRIFSEVRMGMSQDDVRRIAGTPDEVMPFPLSHKTSWGWYYQEQFGYYAMFTATFSPDGRLESTYVRRLNDGGSSHGGR